MLQRVMHLPVSVAKRELSLSGGGGEGLGTRLSFPEEYCTDCSLSLTVWADQSREFNDNNHVRYFRRPILNA